MIQRVPRSKPSRSKSSSSKPSASFFEGWYLKHQTPEHTLILIPSYHLDRDGKAVGTLQVILDKEVQVFHFSGQEIHTSPDRFFLQLGQNVFSEKGCRLHLDTDHLHIRGHLHYGRLHPPKRSFMGPFERLPLPCYHEVLSLSHCLRGRLQIHDNVIWDFNEGIGYMEKDWGHDFPAHYFWIQGNEKKDRNSSGFMLTIADLSIHGHPIRACSSLVLHDGKQYRFSTYQGAHLERHGARRIALRQGPYRLQILLPPEPASSVLLQAPEQGVMKRTIQEYPRCPIRFQLYKGTTVLMDEEKEYGSYELV